MHFRMNKNNKIMYIDEEQQYLNKILLLIQGAHLVNLILNKMMLLLKVKKTKMMILMMVFQMKIWICLKVQWTVKLRELLKELEIKR